MAAFIIRSKNLLARIVAGSLLRILATCPCKDKTVSETKKGLIDDMLLEKISLAGICRVTKVSLSWLYNHIKKKYATVPRKLKVVKKRKGKLVVQMDELWSFVDNKGNKQWLWIAIDAKTREVIGFYIGDRNRKSAEALWDCLPAVYRQCAVCYTDFWESYEGVIPSKRHRAVGKETGKTGYIERLNCTLRQRVSCLVRKTLSLSFAML